VLKRLGKDPTVDTSFLPDKERDEFIDKEKRRLQLEWMQKQEEIKEEELRVDYCFYDGTSHRKSNSIKKGYTVRQFLDLARRQFGELKTVGTDNLILVKEDSIVPHSFTFYELIESQAVGKTGGPLYKWSDESSEKDTTAMRATAHSRVARIVERNYYERNKHHYPFNRWVVWDEKNHPGEKKPST